MCKLDRILAYISDLNFKVSRRSFYGVTRRRVTEASREQPLDRIADTDPTCDYLMA